MMTPIEIEALELAADRCVGRYSIAHLDAWEALAGRGLVRHVDVGDGAWYELTVAGRRALDEIRPGGVSEASAIASSGGGAPARRPRGPRASRPRRRAGPSRST